jgi:hypothetical protein
LQSGFGGVILRVNPLAFQDLTKLWPLWQGEAGGKSAQAICSKSGCSPTQFTALLAWQFDGKHLNCSRADGSMIVVNRFRSSQYTGSPKRLIG